MAKPKKRGQPTLALPGELARGNGGLSAPDESLDPASLTVVSPEQLAAAAFGAPLTLRLEFADGLLCSLDARETRHADGPN